MDLMKDLLNEMMLVDRRLDQMQDTVVANWKILLMLRAENHRYRHIFSTFSQRLFVKDEHLRYILCSRRYASDFNLSVDEIIGKCDEQLFPREAAGMRTQKERGILRSGQADDSVEILNVNGEESAFVTTRTPIMDGNRETVWGIFGVSMDISVYRSRIAALEQLGRHQENLLRDQSQQIAGLQGSLESVISEKRRQEEGFQEFRNHINRQLSLQGQELERFKKDMEHKPKAGNERTRALEKALRKMRDIIDDIKHHVDLMEKPSV